MKVSVILNNNFDDKEFSSYFLNLTCLVIDALRATSTITTIFERGAEKILISQSRKEAFKLKKLFKDYILCGEEKGLKIEGFDYDNSPLHISKLDLKDKNVILKTTNGTKSFIKCSNAKAVFTLSALNLNYALDCALQFARNNKTDILILCSGKLGKNSYDDAFTAGLAIRYLLKKQEKIELDDTAVLTLNAALIEKDIFKAFMKSFSGKCAKELGLINDIHFCSGLNKYKVTGKLEVINYIQGFKRIYALNSYII